MATTYTAFVTRVDSCEMDNNGLLTVGLAVQFFRNVDGTVTLQDASVPVAWNPSSAISTLNDAVTDSLVDYADMVFSWTVPRTRCIFPSYQKGLII